MQSIDSIETYAYGTSNDLVCMKEENQIPLRTQKWWVCITANTFFNYFRNVPIEDDDIMVSFDATSLYTNIPIIDTLNIIKDYINNDDQFTRKTAIPQDKFLDLVHLVLATTWYTLILQFTNKLMALSWEAQHLQPQQKFICRLMNALL